MRGFLGPPNLKTARALGLAIRQISPSTEELRRYVDSEIVRWGEVVKKAGIAASE